MCNDGWLQGWHERNGGNLTYRMGGLEVHRCRDYFRNIQSNPAENIGIVEISPAGDTWRIVWGLENGAVPTSEFLQPFYEPQRSRQGH